MAATGRWAFEASTVYNHKCLYEDTNVFAAPQLNSRSDQLSERAALILPPNGQ